MGETKKPPDLLRIGRFFLRLGFSQTIMDTAEQCPAAAHHTADPESLSG